MRSVTYPNIDAERARNGYTTEDLAVKLNVSRKTLYNWITKGRIPQSKIILLAELFNVSTDYLLQRADNQTTQQDATKKLIEFLKRESN